MTTAITVIGQHGALPADRPDDLEDAYMDGGPAPLWPIFQQLINRSDFARGALWNRVEWSEELSVAPGGSASTFTLTMGAIYSAVLHDTITDTWGAYTAAASDLHASAIEGGGDLAADSWYYLYIFASGGGIQAEISLTAPNASRVRKSGSAAADLARRYLGCFRTDSTGSPFPMRAIRGRYIYRRSAIASVTSALDSDGFRALDTTGTHVAASLDLTKRLPPHARVAILNGEIVATSSGTSGTASLNLFAANDTTAAAHAITANASAVSGDTTRNSSLVEIETTSAQAIRYSVTKTTDLDAYTLDVVGWCE